VAILLTAGVGTFYGFGRLIRSADSVLDYARATSAKDESGAASVHQSKSEKPRVGASGTANAAANSAGEASRKSDPQKRRNGRTDSTHPKTPGLVVPPSTIPPLHSAVSGNR